MDQLYRIITRTAGSVQPDTTFWNTEVLYCGYDRDEARRVYHEAKPSDYWQGYGNSARETTTQIITDSESEDFSDDKIESAHL